MTVPHAYLDEGEDTLHPEQTKKKDDVQSQAIMIAREAHPHQLHQHKYRPTLRYCKAYVDLVTDAEYQATSNAQFWEQLIAESLSLFLCSLPYSLAIHALLPLMSHAQPQATADKKHP